MSNDDRDLREKLSPQTSPRNPDEDTNSPDEEIIPGFGSAEYVPEPDENDSDEPGRFQSTDADDEQDLVQD